MTDFVPLAPSVEPAFEILAVDVGSWASEESHHGSVRGPAAEALLARAVRERVARLLELVVERGARALGNVQEVEQ